MDFGRIAQSTRTQRRNELLHFRVLHGTIVGVLTPDISIIQIVFDETKTYFQRFSFACDRMTGAKLTGGHKTIEQALKIIG